MGLLDDVAGMLGSAGGNAGANPQAVLLQQVIGMLTQSHGGGGLAGAAGGLGGLGGLIGAFQRGGLGHLVESWIGTGQNLPVSPAQITQVLGSGQLAQLAKAAGIDPSQAAGMLSHLLPQVVDHMTPQGQVPAAGALPDLASLAARLMPR